MNQLHRYNNENNIITQKNDETIQHNRKKQKIEKNKVDNN